MIAHRARSRPAPFQSLPKELGKGFTQAALFWPGFAKVHFGEMIARRARSRKLRRCFAATQPSRRAEGGVCVLRAKGLSLNARASYVRLDAAARLRPPPTGGLRGSPSTRCALLRDGGFPRRASPCAPLPAPAARPLPGVCFPWL